MSSDPQHISTKADLAFPVDNSPFPVRYGRPESYVSSLDYVEVPPNPNYYREEFLDYYLKRYQTFWLEPCYLDDLRAAFAEFFGGSYSGSVLDVGCGMGHLHKILGIGLDQYTGLELNGAFVRAGREHFPGIKLVAGLVESMPFRDNSFDCLVCSDVLIHLEDMAVGLREIIRVARGDVLLRLRTGNGASQSGKIVYDPVRQRLFSRIQVSGMWQYFFYNVLSPDDLDALLRQAGITDYQCRELLPADSETLGVTKVFFNVRQAKEQMLIGK